MCLDCAEWRSLCVSVQPTTEKAELYVARGQPAAGLTAQLLLRDAPAPGDPPYAAMYPD